MSVSDDLFCDRENVSYQCHLDLSISNGIFGDIEESEKAPMTVGYVDF